MMRHRSEKRSIDRERADGVSFAPHPVEGVMRPDLWPHLSIAALRLVP